MIFREIGEKYRNWGRWGDDDQIGTFNFVTPERRAAAASLVRRGVTFDLGIPFDSNGPQRGGNRNNPMHFMTETGQDQDYPGGLHFADDYVVMPLQAATQWDGLSHVYYDDRLYNDVPSTVLSPHGASRNAIGALSKVIAGRGVLLDIAKLQGVECLDVSYEITGDDLEAAAQAQGVEVRSGDILCVRTGWRTVFLRTGRPDDFIINEPGLGLDSVAWLHDHEVAAVACDNWAVEILPSTEPDSSLPLHCVLIRDMGMTLGEMFDFEDLARDCAEDGVYEFFVAGPPLNFPRAVGSPVNPLAIK